MFGQPIQNGRTYDPAPDDGNPCICFQESPSMRSTLLQLKLLIHHFAPFKIDSQEIDMSGLLL